MGLQLLRGSQQPPPPPPRGGGGVGYATRSRGQERIFKPDKVL